MNKLEEYILSITEPFDFSGNPQVYNDNQQRLIFELIENQEDTAEENWTPRIPEHASGNQHLNVGLDFFSAMSINSTEVNSCYHFAIIRTGIKIQLPYSHHMMIASRSGLAFKHHIQAFPGIIDHSYRGEIMIKLYAPVEFKIQAGDKIAQGLIFKSQDYIIEQGEVDVNTTRGDKGFGSTGI